jgi:hypothetical protein
MIKRNREVQKKRKAEMKRERRASKRQQKKDDLSAATESQPSDHSPDDSET